MTTRSIYTLEQADVQRHVGRSVILQRGRGYHRADRVSDLEVRDEQLHACVTGAYGNTYKVEIWCEEGELLSTCTCPYNWGVCKHVAAVLYTWLDRRADPETYRITSTAQRRARLEAIPPQVLIDQIMEEMRIDVMLERYVKRWLDKLSPEKLPKLISELFRHLRAGLPTASEPPLERVAHILIWAESLPPDQAINAATAVLKQVQAQPDVLDQPLAGDVVKQSLDILRQRVPRAIMDAPAGRKRLRLLVKLIEHQRPAWQDDLAETLLVLAGGLGLRSFLIEELRKKELLGGPDLLRLLARLYKLEGRREEYEAARSNSLVTEADYLELFQYYLEENRPEEAMILAERGMEHLAADARQLAERLTALYLEWGERELARTHLLRCFDYWPAEELLEKIESLSQGKRGWKAQRARLRKKLKSLASGR